MYEYEEYLLCYGWLYYSVLNNSNSIHVCSIEKKIKEEKNKTPHKAGYVFLFLLISLKSIECALSIYKFFISCIKSSLSCIDCSFKIFMIAIKS